jgi:hypothetical protein
MDIINAPFLKFSPDDIPRPWLPPTIKNPHTDQIINVYGLIDFMPNLNVVLLGVKSFLSSFVLTVDYKKSVFSLKQK